MLAYARIYYYMIAHASIHYHIVAYCSICDCTYQYALLYVSICRHMLTDPSIEPQQTFNFTTPYARCGFRPWTPNYVFLWLRVVEYAGGYLSPAAKLKNTLCQQVLLAKRRYPTFSTGASREAPVDNECFWNLAAGLRYPPAYSTTLNHKKT